MIMEFKSEEPLLSCSDFDPKTFGSLSNNLIVRSLQQFWMCLLDGGFLYCPARYH